MWPWPASPLKHKRPAPYCRCKGSFKEEKEWNYKAQGGAGAWLADGWYLPLQKWIDHLVSSKNKKYIYIHAILREVLHFFIFECVRYMCICMFLHAPVCEWGPVHVMVCTWRADVSPQLLPSLRQGLLLFLAVYTRLAGWWLLGFSHLTVVGLRLQTCSTVSGFR